MMKRGDAVVGPDGGMLDGETERPWNRPQKFDLADVLWCGYLLSERQEVRRWKIDRLTIWLLRLSLVTTLLTWLALSTVAGYALWKASREKAFVEAVQAVAARAADRAVGGVGE